MNSVFVLRSLLFLYILAQPFTNLINLPVVDHKVQAPEIIFVLLCIACIATGRFAFKENFLFTGLEKALLAYTGLILCSTLIHFEKQVILDACGTIYLVLLFFIAKSILVSLPAKTHFVQSAFKYAGIMAGITGLLGWSLFKLNVTSSLASTPDCYFLYTNTIVQATGFMSTPNMLSDFLSICLLLFLPHLVSKEKRSLPKLLFLVFLVVAIALTFSKSILLLIIAILYFLQLTLITNKSIRVLVQCTAVTLFLLAMLSTHFLVTNSQPSIKSIEEDQSCYGKESIAQFGAYKVFQTNYAFNKAAAFYGVEKSPLIGIGPGNFNAFVDELKTQGKYPAYFESFDPHSSITGTLAELGIAGLIILLWIAWQIRQQLIMAKKHTREKTWTSALQAVFLFIAMEALVLDNENFRHVWIMLAVLASLVTLSEKTKEEKV